MNTHEDKINWMRDWSESNGLQLKLEGSCGFGRECVGVSVDDKWPDYQWYNEETYDRIDANGEVWKPEDAYHKHPCVAVLGRGKQAEAQLYEWLQWFDANGFKLETGSLPVKSQIQVLLGQHKYARMVRKETK